MVLVPKIGIYSDVHVSVNSSILSGNDGSTYSKRLDRIVDSFDWMYKTFKEHGVDMIINAGDLTDSDILLPEENSALAECFMMKSRYGMSDIPEYHLVGNHEKKDKNFRHHSIALLKNYENIHIVDKPLKVGNISFLPYTSDYENHGVVGELKNDILISHADYLGLSYNNSKVMNHGFPPDYCLENFEMIFNGHIHVAGQHYDNRLINIGSLLGSSFNDSYYSNYPGIIILDTDTLTYTRVDNVESPIFLKFKCSTIGSLMDKFTKLDTSKYYCIMVEVPYELRDEARSLLDTYSRRYKILATRVRGIVTNSATVSSQDELDSIMNKCTPDQALMEFIKQQTDLPTDSDKVMKFISTYLTDKEVI